MALAYKRGELSDEDVSQEVIDLANSMSEKELEDYAETDREDLPKKVEALANSFLDSLGKKFPEADLEESDAYGTPSSTPGMGPVKAPGSGDFHSQEKGSGDPLSRPPGRRRRGRRRSDTSSKKKPFQSFDDFVKDHGDLRDGH